MEPPAAAAAAAWKTQFRTRLVNLAENCGIAREMLAAARPFIEAPIHSAGAAAARSNLTNALDTLAGAHGSFTLAGMYMLTAQFLALRGGSRNPAQPLTSIEHLAAPDAAARTALAKLQHAFPYADEGCEFIDWCRGVLSVIYRLLEHPGLPGVDALIATEHTEALRLLDIAAQMLQTCTTAATSALQDVAGPW